MNHHPVRRAVTLASAAVVSCSVALTALPSSAAASSPARAQSPTEDEEAGTTGWCTFPTLGGRFYCKSSYAHRLPDGRLQYFVIGTDSAAWTKWQQSNGWTTWRSMGGRCTDPGNDSIDRQWTNPNNHWNFSIQCKGLDYRRWTNTRQPDGQWTGWYHAS